jgi:hypothetical protein
MNDGWAAKLEIEPTSREVGNANYIGFPSRIEYNPLPEIIIL